MSFNNQEGHRNRLREKFIRSGISGFHDYEIVELLLTIGTPRRDCKQQAKEAMRRFKTLRGVLLRHQWKSFGRLKELDLIMFLV